MTPIRPNPGQLPPPAPPRTTADARAAFFRAVLAGQAPAPAAAALRAQAPPAAQPSPRVQAEPVPSDAKAYRRPGSLIDIKV